MSRKVILQSETFKVSEQAKEGEDADGEQEVVIEGVAVPYEQESRNGVIYSEDSIKKAAKSLEGKPFLFNHDPQQVLGRVVEATPADDHLAFKAVADPSKEKVRDIKNGYVSTVSIQAIVSKSEDGPDKRVDVDEFLELSSAPIPGFDLAQASAQAITIEEFAGVHENRKGEPFAGYDDFDDCVSQNQDKSDPEAYCAAIKRDVEESLDDLDLTPTDEMAENAQQVIDWKDSGKVPSDCGTDTGWTRARQLASQEELSPDVVGRMVSFFARHEDNAEVDDDLNEWEDCGYVMWQAWGGDEGREWSERKQAAIEAREADDESYTSTEGFENITERDLHGVIASAYDGLDVSDTISFFDQADYLGVNERQFAELIADAYGVDTGSVLEMLQELDTMSDEPTDDAQDAEPEAEASEEEAEAQEQEIAQKLDRVINMLEELVSSRMDDDDDDEEEEESVEDAADEAVEPSKQPAAEPGKTEDAEDLARLTRETILGVEQ